MELKAPLICPRCLYEAKTWATFQYHVTKFDHEEALRKAKRDLGIINEWLTGRYITPGGMAFTLRLHPTTVYDVLKKAGINWREEQNVTERTCTAGGIGQLPALPLDDSSQP